MNRTIYKYPLTGWTGGQFNLDLPFGAAIRVIGMSQGTPCIWADVVPDNTPDGARTFVVHGTGHPVDPSEHYIGTWFDDGMVWHLFEVLP